MFKLQRRRNKHTETYIEYLLVNNQQQQNTYTVTHTYTHTNIRTHIHSLHLQHACDTLLTFKLNQQKERYLPLDIQAKEIHSFASIEFLTIVIIYSALLFSLSFLVIVIFFSRQFFLLFDGQKRRQMQNTYINTHTEHVYRKK